jgi:hypothetical protein
LEITGEGLVLGARTVPAKMARDTRTTPGLSLGDEQRMMALLASGPSMLRTSRLRLLSNPHVY